MDKHLTKSRDVVHPPLGALLGAAGRRLSAELDERLQAADFDDLRAAHAPVLTSVDAEGTSVGTLAVRLGMTKQAVGELVRYLERQGYVRVVAGADDRRVRLVTFTDRGRDALELGLSVVRGFDRWLLEMIGAREVERLRATLVRIANWPAEDEPGAR